MNGCTWLECSNCGSDFLISDALTMDLDRREPHNIVCGRCELHIDGVTPNDIERATQHKHFGEYRRTMVAGFCENEFCYNPVLLYTEPELDELVLCDKCECEDYFEPGVFVDNYAQ